MMYGPVTIIPISPCIVVPVWSYCVWVITDDRFVVPIRIVAIVLDDYLVTSITVVLDDSWSCTVYLHCIRYTVLSAYSRTSVECTSSTIYIT
jgi:hypothetical protein